MNLLLTVAADILVILASLGAMAYCMVLSRRLSRLTSFDKGLGSAIAVMSSQVDEMRAALQEAKAGSDGAGKHLDELVHQAREISSELEMMIAACHDFAEEAIEVQAPPSAEEARGAADAMQADEMAELLALAGVEPDDDVPSPEAAHPVREDAPPGIGAARPDEATPVFGSRRAAGLKAAGPRSASVEPLFRHRKSAAG